MLKRAAASLILAAISLHIGLVPTHAQPRTVTITFSTGAEGRGLAPGDADPDFTWNYTGDPADPRYAAHIFNPLGRGFWHDYHLARNCIMGDGMCWSNTHYGPDVPLGMKSYFGVEYIYYFFYLPPEATDVVVDLRSGGADDRMVYLINGHEIRGFDNLQGGPQPGIMHAGDGTVSNHTFSKGGELVRDQSLFKPGEPNVLTFWVNNTGSVDPMAPATPHGSTDPSNLTARGVITYEIVTDLPEPTPTSPPTGTPTATSTLIPSATPSPSTTRTPSAKPTPTATMTPTSPPTDEPTPTCTSSHTSTPRPTGTATASPTPAVTPALARCVCPDVRRYVPHVVIADALANPGHYYGWGSPLDEGKPVSPANPLRECLTLQNVNVPRYHPLWNKPVWRVGCP